MDYIHPTWGRTQDSLGFWELPHAQPEILGKIAFSLICVIKYIIPPIKNPHVSWLYTDEGLYTSYGGKITLNSSSAAGWSKRHLRVNVIAAEIDSELANKSPNMILTIISSFKNCSFFISLRVWSRKSPGQVLGNSSLCFKMFFIFPYIFFWLISMFNSQSWIWFQTFYKRIGWSLHLPRSIYERWFPGCLREMTSYVAINQHNCYLSSQEIPQNHNWTAALQ